MTNFKNPEHYICSLKEFGDIFIHTCIKEYHILNKYIVPEYVHKALEVPATLWFNLTSLERVEGDNSKIQEILENVVEHIILHLPYIDDIPFTNLVDMWQEMVTRYLKHKINFNNYLVYMTFHFPDYADDNYHCHIMLFDLRPSEDNNILLKAINKSPK